MEYFQLCEVMSKNEVINIIKFIVFAWNFCGYELYNKT